MCGSGERGPGGVSTERIHHLATNTTASVSGSTLPMSLLSMIK
jgi:hypothetical protein